MGGGSSMEKKKIAWPKDDFIDLVLSWSIKDIFDDTLYQDQVEKIPQSFESAEHYIGSFFFPLLEETRADIAASLKDIVKAPFAELISFDEVEPNGAFDVKVDYWRNKCSDGRVPYRTSPGDIVLISNANPETANDLQRSGYWTFASVIDANENDALVNFKVRVPPYSGIVKGMRQSCHIVFLVNVMPNNRVWDALRMRKNLNMIEKVLRPVPEKRIGQKCDVCSTSINDESVGAVACNLLSKLNDSQASAILTSLATVKCRHKASVELICGPPGTGKTRTLSAMLVTLLRMKCRTITCAPTDVATARVASKLVQLVQETYKNEFDGFCPLGDILLFGNNNCEDGEDIAEISLDYRVGRLAECLAPMTGWNHCVSSMINFLEELSEQEEAPKVKVKNSSLIDFSQFSSIASSLRKFLLTICTHVPIRFLRGENVESIVRALSLLNSHERMLFHKNVGSRELQKLFSCQQTFGVSLSSQSLVLLKDLQKSLGKLDFPTATRKDRITEFCIQMASSVFSSASTSYKLHSVDMEPFDLLVVDDACQLKECEAVIPLQLRVACSSISSGNESRFNSSQAILKWDNCFTKLQLDLRAQP
ncbi:helicase sen1-like [Lycium ferocissimum]|uniref:helicase sen1-like n=1 Tax=Lycium ferocissimum TaxID=112874 RepID=UPI002814BDFF|nr:helicase sen1-like [Lycium ferocissimum]